MMNRQGFFHFYTPETSLPKMLIPTLFITSIGRPLPKRVFLRDCYDNWWCVRVRQFGETWYFTKGWQRFVRDNELKSCDFIVFDYFVKDMFDFKILGLSRCDTIGAGGLVYYENDRENDVFEDELDDEEKDDDDEDEDEEWDFGGGDDDHCCKDEYNLSMKQKIRSIGDGDDRINDKFVLRQEPKSESDEENSGGIYKFHMKKEPKRDDGGDVRVKKEPKLERYDVRKEPKRERDDGLNVCGRKHPKHLRDDVKREPKHRQNDGCDVYVKKESTREQDDGRHKDHDDNVKNHVIKKKNHVLELVVKKELEDEGDGCCDKDVVDVENLDDACVKKAPTHKLDDGGDEVLNDYVDDDDHDDFENHDNNYDVSVGKEPRREVDDGCDEVLDDYANDDARGDMENHENVTMSCLPQILEDVDTENYYNVVVQEEPLARANINSDHVVDDDEENILNEENEQEEYVPKYAIKVERPGGPTRKRACVFPKFYGMHIFESGVVPKPRNPYFITHVAISRKGDLFIPTELIKDHNLEMPQPKMMLVDEHGRQFWGKYKKWKDGRILYNKGWRTLWKVNRITPDDFCLCEFHEGPNGLYLKVTAVYVNGGPPISTPRKTRKKKGNRGQ